MNNIISDKELGDIAISVQKSMRHIRSFGWRTLLCKNLYSNIENAHMAQLFVQRCCFKAVSDGKGFENQPLPSSNEYHAMWHLQTGLQNLMKEGIVVVTNGQDIKRYSVEELIPGCFTL